MNEKTRQVYLQTLRELKKEEIIRLLVCLEAHKLARGIDGKHK